MGGARRTTGNFVFCFNLCDGGNVGWTLGLALAEAPWELLRFPQVTRLLCAPHPSGPAIPSSSVSIVMALVTVLRDFIIVVKE